MAFNVDLQILSQPGSTGQQTYNLAAGFDPKAVIIWTSGDPAGDLSGGQSDYLLSLGFGTYRGGSVQQRYSTIFGRDNQPNADTAGGGGDNAICKLYSATTPTVDLEIDLVSMTNSGTPNVVLDWVNLFTDTTIKVYMLVLGGSEITDALVSSFDTTGTASANQDVTVVSGFGQPELVFFMHSRNAGANADETGDARFGVGFAKKGEAGRGFSFRQTDGNTASIIGAMQRSDKCVLVADANGSGGSVIGARATSGEPTDGFRITYDAGSTAGTRRIGYLALRTTAQIATGNDLAPSADGNLDDNVGFTPKMALAFGWNLGALTGLRTTDAALLNFSFGAYDGTDQAVSWITEDDAAGTMNSNRGSWDDGSAMIVNYNQSALVQDKGQAAFTGTTFRRVWDVLNSATLAEHQWIVMGDAAGGDAETVDPTDSVTTSDAISFSEGESQADSVTTSDARSFADGKAVSDSVSTSDAVRFDEGESIADSVTVSDGVTAEKGVTAAPSDSVSVSDAVSVDIGVRPADSVSLTEAVRFDESDLLTDSVSVSDGLSLSLTIPVNDSVSPSDATALVFGRAALPADSVSLTEALSFAEGDVIQDSLSLNDSAQVAESDSTGVADSVTLSDDATVELQAAGESESATPEDSVSVSDAVRFDEGEAVADSVNTTEQVRFSEAAVFTDSLALSDEITIVLQVSLSVSDSVTSSDLIDVLLDTAGNIPVEVNDSVTITDQTFTRKRNPSVRTISRKSVIGRF
jgi:hypothetical protein